MDEHKYREVETRLWDSLGVRPTESFIELSTTGTSVRVQEVGQGPPVLLIHGGAISGASWAPLVAEMQQFRCLMIDRPGCGLSPAAPVDSSSIGSFLPYAQGLAAAVLDGMQVDRAHLVGTSFGGFFSFHGAAANPQRIEKLVGIGSIFGSPMEHIPLIMRVGSLGPLPKLMAKMPSSRQAVRAILRQIGLKDAMKAGRITREFEDWFLANMKHTDTMINETSGLPQIIDMKGMVPESVITAEILARITVPTKLIWGENDPMAGADVARTFASQLPQAELELWPNTGHAPWIDDPTRAAKSITDFLTE